MRLHALKYKSMFAMKAFLAKLAWLILMLYVLPMFGQRTSVSEPFQYKEMTMAFHALTIEDGLSQGMVNAICQDQNGFIWIGTKDGLNQYDGYGFKIFRNNPDEPASIGSNFIQLLLNDSQGRLWIGHSKGLDVYSHQTESFVHIDLNPPDGHGGGISKIIEDHHGDIWLGFTEGLAKLTFEEKPDAHAQSAWLPDYHVKWFTNQNTRMGIDLDGKIWGDKGGGEGFWTIPQHKGDEVFMHANTWKSTLKDQGPPVYELVVIPDTLRNKLYGVHRNGVLEIDRSTGEFIELYAMSPNEGTLTNNNAGMDREGFLWIPTYSGLFRFDPDAREMVRAKPEDRRFVNQGDNVKSVFFDANGLMWVGTSGYGLLKFDPRVNRFHRVMDNSIIGLQPGVDNKLVTSKYETFLNLFDPSRMKYDFSVSNMFELPENFKFEEYDAQGRVKKESGRMAFQSMLNKIADQRSYIALQSIYALQDREGNFWISNNDLFCYRPATNTLEHYTDDADEDGVGDGAHFPLHLADNGVLWSGGSDALWKFDLATKRSTPFRFPVATTSTPYLFTTCILEAKDGNVWVGTLKGVLRLNPQTGEWKHYRRNPDDQNGLAVDIVFSVAEDPIHPERYVWIGTNGGGLNKLDFTTGEMQHFTTEDGLPNDVIYGVLGDELGNIWMSTNKGIVRMNVTTGELRSFGAGDGLQSDEFNRYAYCKGEDGTMFFGGVNGFNFFKPSNLVEDKTPVTVRITDIKLLNKSVRFGPGELLAVPAYMSDQLEIPHHLNVISFHFASMEYSAPEKHRYQYKLDGFDPDWIDAGTRHVANYTNLHPGTYVFWVRGDNADGIWNEQATRFTLVVLPPWWRTWWFYTLCFIVVAGSVLLYIISLRRQKRKLEKTVVQRTAEVRHERDKNDELLNNILPAEISEVLKKKGRVEARYFKEVTILISDFKSFTEVSEHLSPAQLVDELNVCFKEFDRIMVKYGIEKIKTIGDAYLAAGGVPDPNFGSPRGVVYAALEMQLFMEQRKIQLQAEGRRAFEMRVGVHTGSVVAGVVGKQKFQYDLWGASLGVADLIENASPVGRVLISESTYDKVKQAGDLVFVEGPLIQVPDQTALRTYLVQRSTS